MFNTQVKGDQSEIRTEGTRITLVNKVTHNLMPEPLNLRPPAVPSPQTWVGAIWNNRVYAALFPVSLLLNPISHIWRC